MNVDAGCLSVTNPIQISSTSTKSLLETTTSTLQHLITTLFTLPQKQTQDGLHATLPLPTTKLPRARKLPKPKPPTKWELFAKAKGIAPKKKKERWVHDAQAGIDRPAWGYKSKENDDMQDWLIEVPDNADPSVDVRQEVKDEKKKRIEKNKKQQIGNLERSGRMQSLEDAIKTTRKSTASLGKFDATLRNEPKYKRGEKRKVGGFLIPSLTLPLGIQLQSRSVYHR